MVEVKNKFYVTTPIYYVTAKPHLGSLYSTLLADVAARWHKLCGAQVFFLTGTDEHGQKVAEAAAKAGKQPKEFVDSFIDAYKTVWYNYAIQYDYFVRTTDESHIKAVQEWLRRLLARGVIYKAFYSGFYCTPCETYVTEKDTGVQQQASATQGIIHENSQNGPACVSCGRITGYVSEESYFFKLSAYQDKLLQFYEDNPDFITPPERMHEVIAFVKSGLKDLSISRTTVRWGIPFPDDSQHITYVWADALNNYITAVGYANPARQQEFELWWPADMQVMGKDIVRFHAIYWPAFLMACDLALPKKLLVHGWLKINNQKMSKSFGNIVDPQVLLEKYGADAVRYYLVRYMAITHDAEFSTQDLEQRVTADLANDLGNLLNRMVTLAHNYSLYEIKAPQQWGIKEVALRDVFWNMLELFADDMQEGYFSRALAGLWKFIGEVNSYFHEQEPWKLAKTDHERFEQVISATCHSLYASGVLLSPVLPTKMAELLQVLGAELIPGVSMHDLQDNPWNKNFMLSKTELLFTKYDPVVAQPAQQIQVQAQESAKQASQIVGECEQMSSIENITIDDFTKIYLLVGTIEQCSQVPKSDKLLQLQVNFGPYGTRQILSGVRQQFSHEELVGRQGIFVYNLAPRKLMGLESHGMMLFAQDSQTEKLRIVAPEQSVPNGTRLK